MTNEELVQQIREGDEDLIPVLWENVQKLLYMMSRRVYITMRNRCDHAGVDESDIKQEAYFVFLDALKAYDPESGYMFTTYLRFPFQSNINKLLGLRTSREKNEPLSTCTSLHKPVEDADGDSCELLDLLPDEHSTDFVQRIDDESEAATVRAAVDALPEPQKCAVRLYYFDGLTLRETGERLSVTKERARRIVQAGVDKLRKNKMLFFMYRESKIHERWIALYKLRYSPEHYATVKYFEEKILMPLQTVSKPK